MKKFLTLALSALLTMGLLTACGGKTTDKTVDLTAFYNTLAEEYGWAEDAASSGEEDIMIVRISSSDKARSRITRRRPPAAPHLSRPGRCGHQAADRQSPHDQRRGE